MPLLQLDTTRALSADEKADLAGSVTDRYTQVMETSAGHVAVTIRERSPGELHLGRAVDGPLLFLGAHVRRGRPFEQRRRFAVAVMDHVAEAYGVPEPNLKVVFTEHAGEDMMGADRVGGEWGEE